MNAYKTNVAIASALGGKAHRVRADAFAATILPAIAEARAAGATSLRAVADVLNARGIPTARGGKWSPAKVQRIAARGMSEDLPPGKWCMME